MFLGQACGNATTPPTLQMACDGKSNDTAALSALLRAGGRVEIPAGVCIIDGASFEGGRIDLRGSRDGGTLLKLPVGSPRDILTLVNVTGTISDLGFDQRGAIKNSTGLRVNYAKGLRISRLRIANPNSYGALFHFCTRCTLDGLTSTGGGTTGAWIVAFLEGKGNTVRNVSSVDAVNRTLVMELETGALVENISARDGVAQTVLFDRVSHSIGRNWIYVDSKGQGLDDAFAIIGQSEYNWITNVVAERPAGFGFTFASQFRPEIGAPRYNQVHGLHVERPGQQILSFTDDGADAPPYCNLVTGLTGINPNQQPDGEFPGLDYFGARENAVIGNVYSRDKRMTWGLWEVDNEAKSARNAFIGHLDAGKYGTTRLLAKGSKAFILTRSENEAAALGLSNCALGLDREARGDPEEKR